MNLLALDAGTTHTKAALFSESGSLLGIASKKAPVRRSGSRGSYYDPEEYWMVAVEVARAALSESGCSEVSCIGITGMAESGLLVDARTGEPRSSLIPWFDTSAEVQAKKLVQEYSTQDAFFSGIQPTFKCSLAKVLWLQEQTPGILGDGVWLCAPDYLALRLSSEFATDYSLAGRTFAFDIFRKQWEEGWLVRFGLTREHFPPAAPAGTPIGALQPDPAALLGLRPGASVSVAGHDHLSAALGLRLATGTQDAKQVFSSLGTAEALFGTVPPGFGNGRSARDASAFPPGFSYGCDVLPGGFYWMGGLSSSGASVEWLLSILSEPALSYASLAEMLEKVGDEPGDLLYFPYLSGSGSPHTDTRARGAFLGLGLYHTQAHLLKAVLEGVAMEMEFIRRFAQGMVQHEMEQILAAGGGTKLRRWMQIRADVTGLPILVPSLPEAALLGAAMLARSGTDFNLGEALHAVEKPDVQRYEPVPESHQRYQELFERKYVKMQEPLRAFYHLGIPTLDSGDSE